MVVFMDPLWVSVAVFLYPLLICEGTPIINLPQTAVLGLHATKERPVVVKGQIVIRPMMYLGTFPVVESL